MKISVDLIKELRNLTSCSIADCRKALTETEGNVKKAQELLRKRGLEIAAKKKTRTTGEGIVSSYIHLGGKIGVLVEINCETDFVARNEDFNKFAKDVAMQIAACNPQFINKEDVPKEVLKGHEDKDAFIKQTCLMEQPFIKDQGMTLRDCLGELIGKIGENISISRFARFSIKQGTSICGIDES